MSDRCGVNESITGHGEHSAAHAGIEAEVTGADIPEHRYAGIFEVDVHDAIAEAPDKDVQTKHVRGRYRATSGFCIRFFEDVGNFFESPCDHHQDVNIRRF